MFKLDFITACIKGKTYLGKINSYIEAWHKSEDGLDKELFEFLGMSKDEYALWVERPDVLPFIIIAHKNNVPVSQVIFEADTQPIAARAPSIEKAHELHNWLIETKRIPA